MISREGYAAVLKEYGLWRFPRRVGAPFTVTVGNPAGFYRFFDSNNDGTKPMFVSHNAFAVPEAGGKLDVNKYVFNTAFGDMDNGDNNGLSPEAVWDEVCRVSEWLRKKNVPYALKYSGSNTGFHLHLFFKEETRFRAYLEMWENALWRGMTSTLRLSSINIRCAVPTCLERLPFTRYVHKKDPAHVGYKAESNYCVPVPFRYIVGQDLDAIKELSRRPKLEIGTYKQEAPLQTLESFVRENKWESFGPERTAFHPDSGIMPVGKVAELIQLQIPDKKCLQVLSFETNPKHDIRLALAVELTALGYGLNDLTVMIDAIAEEAKWIDRMNTDVRHGQVMQIHRRGYKPFSCQRLRSKGCCVGPSCKLFKRAFPGE